MPDADVLRTGIAGLDDILLGGLPRGNVVVVTGSPGTGKTTLGVEFVYSGAHDFDEPGIIVTFEVSAEKLVRDAAQFGWDLRALEAQGRLKILSTTRRVFEEEIVEPDSVLLTEATTMGAHGSSSTVWPGYPGTETGTPVSCSTRWSKPCTARA